MPGPAEADIARAEAVAMSGDDVSLGELRRTLARIELRQESIATDHEARLRGVERWMYALPVTSVTALGAAVTAIVLAVVQGGP